MLTRARPRAQYLSTVTMVARAQRLSSPLFSWQRFSTVKNQFENYDFSWQLVINEIICSTEYQLKRLLPWFDLLVHLFNPILDSWHSSGSCHHYHRGWYHHLYQYHRYHGPNHDTASFFFIIITIIIVKDKTIIRLWEAMQFRLSPSCLRYKLYRLHMVSFTKTQPDVLKRKQKTKLTTKLL